MSNTHLIEIEITETTVETDDFWVTLAINLGVTVAGVLIGNAVYWGAGKIKDAFIGKKREKYIIDVKECEITADPVSDSPKESEEDS